MLLLFPPSSPSATGNAIKEHEDLVFPGPPKIVFHWFARFADHQPFAELPLGMTDERK